MIKIKMPQLYVLIIHHLMIIMANTFVNFNKDLFVIKVIALNYLTEFTTPILNISLYLYQNKKTNLTVKNINVFKTTNIILLISFFFFRVVLGFYLVKVTLFYNLLSIFQVLMLFMNIHWFLKLLNKVNKHLNRKTNLS